MMQGGHPASGHAASAGGACAAGVLVLKAIGYDSGEQDWHRRRKAYNAVAKKGEDVTSTLSGYFGPS
jgi:hypothetical protein